MTCRHLTQPQFLPDRDHLFRSSGPGAGAALKRLERRGDPPTSTSTSSKWSNLSSRSNIKHKIYGGSTQTLDTRYYRYTDRDCSAPLPVVVIVSINYLCHYKRLYTLHHHGSQMKVGVSLASSTSTYREVKFNLKISTGISVHYSSLFLLSLARQI